MSFPVGAIEPSSGGDGPGSSTPGTRSGLDDGTPVEVHNKGYYVEAEPGSGPRYYLTTPRFRVGRVIDPERAEEGGTPPHAWLEQSVVVGEAFDIDPEHIRIEVHLVEHGVTL